jgi:predicted dehydrogenase
MKVAVIGYGYWGTNVARAFTQSPAFDLDTICDLSADRRAAASRTHPAVRCVKRIEDIPDTTDVVATITPVDTHYRLARHFLEKGKHVLVTKSFTRTLEEAETLIRIAGEQEVAVFVDHTFVFNPAVRSLKKLLPRIGQPYFLLSQRLNLGRYQPDVNVLYDLMPHDLSIISYLFESEIKSSTCLAFSAAGLPQEDFAQASFTLQNGVRGTVTVSWLAPSKVREFTIVGSNGMLTYDDTRVAEKVKLYDKSIRIDGVDEADPDLAYTARISYRTGDLFSPAISDGEALAIELVEFERAIRDPEVRRRYDAMNRTVMKDLEAILQSVRS